MAGEENNATEVNQDDGPNAGRWAISSIPQNEGPEGGPLQLVKLQREWPSPAILLPESEHLSLQVFGREGTFKRTQMNFWQANEVGKLRGSQWKIYEG